jgi:hypothetical protein
VVLIVVCELPEYSELANINPPAGLDVGLEHLTPRG